MATSALVAPLPGPPPTNLNGGPSLRAIDRPSVAVGGVERLRQAVLYSRWFRVLAVSYVALTLYGSARFLITSNRFLVNDFFWVDFNATGAALFVANAVNLVLPGIDNSTDRSLTDGLFATTMQLDQSAASIPFSPHYGRLVQYHRLTGIEDAIVGLRGTTGSRMHYIFTQYCWVDFDRRWSLAHTQKRADRCLESYRDNGAVYLEAVIRNSKWEDFISTAGQRFQTGVGNALRDLPGGTEFLKIAISTATSKPDINTEAAYWRSKGIRHFVLQYHNAFQIGVDEYVDVVNALGMRRPIAIKKDAYVDRWPRKTTIRLYWGFVNDLWAVVSNNTRISGMSLVRNASNFFENANLTVEQIMMNDGVIDMPMTWQDSLLRARVGPFGSFDLLWTIFPLELSALMLETRAIVLDAVRSSYDIQVRYLGVSPIIAKMAYSPVSWLKTNRSFVGSGPLCSHGAAAVPYATQQFLFDGVCTSTIIEGGYVDAFYFVFAALASGVVSGNNSASICEGSSLDRDVCANGFDGARSFIGSFISMSQQERLREQANAVRALVTPMNITIMQYAQTMSPNGSMTHELLELPVLSADPDDLWNPIGWFYLLDWVTGRREVVSFQGDAGTLTLISGHTNPSEFPTNSADIPHSMSVFLNIGVRYVTAMLTAVAALVLAFALHNRLCISPLNLMEFNHVTAIVWIGRPLLFLRGIVAICILSTASPVLQLDGHFSSMIEAHTSWFATLLASGEVTWVVCVMVDLLLLWTIGRTYYLAPMCNVVVWLAAILLQVIDPMQHKMTIDPQCAFVALERQVVCHSATIEIGSLKRASVLLLVVLVAFVVCWVVVWCCCRGFPLRSDGIVLPGIAQEVFQRDGWVHSGDWYVDQASAVMAGLVSVPWYRVRTVVDIKTWMILQVNPKPSNTAASDAVKCPEELRNALQLRALQPRMRKIE